MTKSDILKLKPEFKFGNGGNTMIDWFEITEADKYYRISSGLRHADGVTKSPYYYYDSCYGKNAKKDALIKFNEWWNSLNIPKWKDIDTNFTQR